MHINEITLLKLAHIRASSFICREYVIFIVTENSWFEIKQYIQLTGFLLCKKVETSLLIQNQGHITVHSVYQIIDIKLKYRTIYEIKIFKMIIRKH